MVTIIIGDIHGRPYWKNIVALHPRDHIIFVGDYFDSKENYSAHDQIINFHKILAFKKSNPARVTLLLGNHDYHYLPFAGETYSGFQDIFAGDIYNVLKPAIAEKLLTISLQVGKYLVSHAGLTRTWCRQWLIPEKSPAAVVNELFYTQPEAFRFSPGKKREPTGDEPEQGPLWVRLHSLEKDGLTGFVHIVGHTQQPSVYERPTIICIDVLGYTPKYLEINEEGQTNIRTLA